MYEHGLNEISIFMAIRSLVPDAQCYVEDNDWNKVNWSDKNDEKQPTKAAVDAEIVRLQAESDAQEYARKRKEEYES